MKTSEVFWLCGGVSCSVVINSLHSFSVPFSAIIVLRSARCMRLLSVSLRRLIITDTDTLHAHSEAPLVRSTGTLAVGLFGKPSDFAGDRREWRHVERAFRDWFGFLHDAAEEWLDQQVPLESLRKRSRIAERRDKALHMSLAMVWNEAQ